MKAEPLKDKSLFWSETHQVLRRTEKKMQNNDEKLFYAYNVRSAVEWLKEKRRAYICKNGEHHTDEKVVTWRDVEEAFADVIHNTEGRTQ